MSTRPTESRQPKSRQPELLVRRPKTDLGTADLPAAERGGWLVPGDPINSQFLATLSAVFPNGEDFFVYSVRNFREAINGNAELRQRVKGFIGQEAMHGREHRVLNERLQALGYPTAVQDKALLAAAERLKKLPPNLQLATTAASEHFTAVIAENVLRDPQTRRTLFPQIETELLITWHALEELEHKDVAFDVLAEVDGRYRTRAAGLGLAAQYFGTVVAFGFLRAVWSSRSQIGLRELRSAGRNHLNQRMLRVRTLGQILRYLQPGFHPSKVHTDHIVQEWRYRLEDKTTSRATPRAS